MQKNQNKKEMSHREKLVEEYLKYANSQEAFGVLFAKKYLRCFTNQYWADINSVKSHQNFTAHKLEFEEVVCTLYPRKIRPVYPDKMKYIKSRLILPYEKFVKIPTYKETLKYLERDYLELCRAITWDISHEDIEEQKENGVLGTSFVLKGRMVEVLTPNTSQGKGNEKPHEKEQIFEILSAKKMKESKCFLATFI